MSMRTACLLLLILPTAFACPAGGVVDDDDAADDDDAVDDDDATDDDDAAETTYEFVLFDSWSDGWGEHSLEVRDGSDVLLQTLTLAEGGEGSFLVTSPDCVSATFVENGIFAQECSYEVKDAGGNTLFSSDNVDSAPGTFSDCE